ncbi:hypothetical protein U1Q18_013365 [Sarracenia purpurea var. burkii]
MKLGRLLGYATTAEAIMVLLLTIPGFDALRKGLISVSSSPSSSDITQSSFKTRFETGFSSNIWCAQFFSPCISSYQDALDRAAEERRPSSSPIYLDLVAGASYRGNMLSSLSGRIGQRSSECSLLLQREIDLYITNLGREDDWRKISFFFPSNNPDLAARKYTR